MPYRYGAALRRRRVTRTRVVRVPVRARTRLARRVVGRRVRRVGTRAVPARRRTAIPPAVLSTATRKAVALLIDQAKIRKNVYHYDGSAILPGSYASLLNPDAPYSALNWTNLVAAGTPSSLVIHRANGFGAYDPPLLDYSGTVPESDVSARSGLHIKVKQLRITIIFKSSATAAMMQNMQPLPGQTRPGVVWALLRGTDQDAAVPPATTRWFDMVGPWKKQWRGDTVTALQDLYTAVDGGFIPMDGLDTWTSSTGRPQVMVRKDIVFREMKWSYDPKADTQNDQEDPLAQGGVAYNKTHPLFLCIWCSQLPSGTADGTYEFAHFGRMEFVDDN